MDFHLISLGCAKNRVDSEIVLADLMDKGHRPVDDPEAAELILVNTCAFIQPAVDEAIDTLLEAARFKEEGRARFLIGLGCLPQRYGQDLSAEMSEVDLFIPPASLASAGLMIQNLIGTAPGGDGGASDDLLFGGEPFLYRADTPRALSTSPGSAYVKIAEGCPNRCTYCTIPSIRGAQHSRTVDDVLTELAALAAEGVVEANLVAQDLTAFGSDLDLPGALIELIKGLDGLETAPRWVRLLYLNPALVDDDLLAAAAASERVIPYLDVPLQHAAPGMMKRMGRRPPGPDMVEWAHELRRKVPGVALRTTVMVGFPGETEEDFQMLMDFIRRARIDHLGAFAFCPEQGTPAARMGDIVNPETAAGRLDLVLEAQAGVSAAINRERVGQTVDVLVEGPHPESDLLLSGRARFQAPEVDGGVIITAGQGRPGRIQPGRIVEAHQYDLVVELDED